MKLRKKNKKLEAQLKKALDKIERLERLIKEMDKEMDVIHLNEKSFNELLDAIYYNDVPESVVRKLASGKYELDFECEVEDMEDLENAVRVYILDLYGYDAFDYLGTQKKEEYINKYYYAPDKNSFVEVKESVHRKVSNKSPIIDIQETPAPKWFKEFWHELNTFSLSRKELDSFRKKLNMKNIDFLCEINELLSKNEKCLLSKETKTFHIYKNLVDQIDDESITPKTYFEKVFEIEDLKEDVVVPQEYIDVINGYIIDLANNGRYGYTIDFHQEIIDEVYEESCDDWYLAKNTRGLLYDAENDVLISFYEDTYQHYEYASCEKAPSWFKSGWEGLVNKTLSAEDFISYYCKLRDNNYLEFSGLKSQIEDFLNFLEEEGKLKVIGKYSLSVDRNDDFFEESNFPEESETDGELIVAQFVESEKFLEEFTPYCEETPIVTRFLDSLEKSYLNTLLQVGEMGEEDFLQLLENDNLNSLGISSGIDSFMKKNEERELTQIFKLSSLSDIAIIGVADEIFAYKPLGNTFFVSKPFSAKMVKELKESSRIIELTQQRQSECLRLKEETERYTLATIRVKKEIEGLNKDIQEMKTSVVVKTANIKNEEFLIKKLEEELQNMQEQKNQLDKIISDTWNTIYTKEDGKRIFQKYVSADEKKLNSIKEDIKKYSSNLLD